jgi:hypothetical protein
LAYSIQVSRNFCSLFFAIFIAVLARSSAFAATQAFDGLSAILGVQIQRNASTSNVSYHYENKFSNSLNPPGVSRDDSYILSGQELKGMPSLGILYVKSTRVIIWGFSAALNFGSPNSVTNEKFDFYRPSNSWDAPRGFEMTTILTPKTDLRISFEPGISLSSNSMAYLRLSYYQLNEFVTTQTKVTYGLIDPIFTEASSDETFKGTGVGVGVRWKYNEKTFIEASFDQVTYEAQTMTASSMTSVPDEVTLSQSQELTPRWSVYGISFGFQF